MVDGRRRAFTLIELLCVVAIIALLAALLMPALRGAKDRAKAVACMNNMRELYVAFATYASMFDDKYAIPGTPYFFWKSDDSYNNTRGVAFWHYLGKGGGLLGQMISYRGPIFGYGQTHWPVLRCPADTGSPRPEMANYGVPYYDSELSGSSYFMNWSVNRYCYYVGYCPCENWSNCDPHAYPFRRGFSAGPERGKPSEAWLLIDCPDTGHWWTDPPVIAWGIDNPPHYAGYHDYCFRHPGERANFAYLDGHVDARQHVTRTGVPLWYEIYASSPP